MRTIGLVALHVFRDSVRDKVLYSIVAFAVILIAIPRIQAIDEE